MLRLVKASVFFTRFCKSDEGMKKLRRRMNVLAGGQQKQSRVNYL